MLDALTRGLPLDSSRDGYGVEERGVMVSYQAQSPALGLVLPSNSPGVHTLWLPVIPMQIGLVLKPGPQEPWTPYRMAAAFVEAGIPRRSDFDLSRRRRRGRGRAGHVHAEHDLRRHGHGRALQGQPARAGPRPGLQQDPAGRRRGRRLGKVSRPDGRQRLPQQRPRLHQLLGHLGLAAHREIAAALAERIGPVEVNAARRSQAGLAAFTVPGVARRSGSRSKPTCAKSGVEHMTGPVRPAAGRDGALRLSAADGRPLRFAAARRSPSKEYMFPFVTVVKCPQEKMLESIGPTLVCTAPSPRIRRSSGS